MIETSRITKLNDEDLIEFIDEFINFNLSRSSLEDAKYEDLRLGEILFFETLRRVKNNPENTNNLYHSLRESLQFLFKEFSMGFMQMFILNNGLKLRKFKSFIFYFNITLVT